MESKKTAYLILENGDIFEGYSFGNDETIEGECVFTTGMSGYQETLTDPTNCGQIIVQTFPLIGNYGVNQFDFESGGKLKCVAAKGYVVREFCSEPSNFREDGNIEDFLSYHGVSGIYGIDTRALTKTIRESGTMNAILTTNPDYEKMSFSNKQISPVPLVSVKTTEIYPAKNELYKIALIDYGFKKSIKDELVSRGATVTVFPWNTPSKDILSDSFDGVVLSNGPGDPLDNPVPIEIIKELLSAKIPLFGICLGHLLAASAAGAKTFKLKYGHRGENQPVRDIKKERIYVTAQNHGYAVDTESLPSDIAYISHENVNDSTCEGIRYKNTPAFTVQFHPEANGGPLDTRYLFDEFIDLILENKKTLSADN